MTAELRALAAEGARHRDRHAVGRIGFLCCFDGPRPLEAGQSRVEGAEGHVREDAELVAQAPTDLIPVHLAVLEEAEDG